MRIALLLIYSWLPLQAATIQANLSGFTANEVAVVEEVMDFWSEAILDSFTVHLSISKLDMAGDLLAAAFNLTEDADGRPLGGTIEVDNRAGAFIGWFVDPTPATSEEFGPGATPYHQYGRRPGLAGEYYDMLTVLHHEFAHLFGFSTAYTKFAARLTPYEVAPLRQFTGDTVTALLAAPSEGTHLSDAVHPFDLMTAYQSRGERILPSDLDLAILADTYGYTVAIPAPDAVPEPVTIVLTAVGLALLCALRRTRIPSPAALPVRPSGSSETVRSRV